MFGSLVKEAPGLCAGPCQNEASALVNYYDWSSGTANRDSDVGLKLRFPGRANPSDLDSYCDGCDISSVGHYVTYRCGGNATDIPGIRSEGACSSESEAGGAGATCNLIKIGAGGQLFKCGILYEMKCDTRSSLLPPLPSHAPCSWTSRLYLDDVLRNHEPVK